MSGFITIYNINGEPVDEHLIHSLTQSLKFRGPDRQNVWVDDHIGMGHALFKTTFEAEYENQPTTIDNNTWITCSARIDDRENLVHKMGMKKEINLTKTPDSELILHAYRKWGEECLTHLLGDFAFVIWDKQKQKLFCARDRFGMRQLYFAQKNKSIIICNALGCILKHPKISKELNEKAIGGFLLFGRPEWMDKSITMFHDVTTLLPAHKLIMENGHINIQRYWKVPDDIPLLHYKKEQDYVDHFLEVFTSAVSDRLRTSSVAISMSGGMDSTSIAAIAKQLQKEQKFPTTQLNAVSLAYDHILPSKERYYAGLTAQHLDIPIHYIASDDYPFLYPSIKTICPMELAQPTLLLDTEKKYSQFGRVVLVGVSGDDLIKYPSTLLALKEAGIYSVMRDTVKLHQLYGKRPPLGIGLRTKLKRWISNDTRKIQTAYPYPAYINHDFEERLGLRTEWERAWISLQEKQLLHTRYAALQGSLIVADWNSDDMMLQSDFTLSEKRDPYLDLRMLEFILSLPALPWLFNKHILRHSMKGILPDEVRYRPKTPLGYLNHALTKKDENRWLKAWKPSNQSLLYSKETFSFTLSDTPLQHHLTSRPIMLDAWLQKNAHYE
jgi:asparagine synthase (glutamine-hydrolysing)